MERLAADRPNLTAFSTSRKMPLMETKDDTLIPADLKAELETLLANPAGGIRDPEKAREARARMDRIREENRRLFGESDIAVELIRQTRAQ